MSFAFLLCSVLAPPGESRLGEKPVAQHVRIAWYSLVYQEGQKGPAAICPPKKLPQGYGTCCKHPFGTLPPAQDKVSLVPTKWAVDGDSFSWHFPRPVWVTFQANSYTQL